MKCCVCLSEIKGKPHQAPEGVYLCSPSCFQEWKLTIVAARSLIETVNRLFEASKMERQKDKEARLESTYNWILNYDQKIAGKYVS